MSSRIACGDGNGKRHRTPPRLVCFCESIWIKIKEIIKEEPLERKKNYRRVKKEKISSKEKVNRCNKETETQENHKSRNGYFPLDGNDIRIKLWWEKENWAMVTDPENPFGDLTEEEEIRIAEMLKGTMVNSRTGMRKWHRGKI